MKTLCVALVLVLTVLISCEKSSLPAVKTVSHEVVTLDTVVLTGKVIAESGSTVVKRGFCWSTHPNPTLNDTFSENQFGPGIFTEKIPNLELGREYFFRAYAVNASGAGFGEVLSFTVELKPEFGSMTDARDGRSYNTVKIGHQTWMAENLAYLPSVSPTSSKSASEPYYYVAEYLGSDLTEARIHPNYLFYGTLYNWSAAMAADTGSTDNPVEVKGVCPEGWHLPSDEEFTILTNYLGPDAFKMMKSINGWYGDNGNNMSGFNALRCPEEYAAYYWTASTHGTSGAWYLSLGFYGISDVLYNGIHRWFAARERALSVRCVRNGEGW